MPLRKGAPWILSLALLGAVGVAPSIGAAAAESPKAALLIVSSTNCSVSVDAQKVADLKAEEPLRLEVSEGEYLVSATAADGRRWFKVVPVAGPKTIVQISFAEPARLAAAPAPATDHPAAAATPAAGGPAPTAAPAPPVDRRTAGPNFSWIPIPAGEFEMGCSGGDTECTPVELPRRRVRVSTGFEMMDRPVTVAQFRDWSSSTSGKLPKQPKWSADDVPVVNVTWDEAVAFCSASAGTLPTEIEWEYAARAGSPAARYGEINEIAWYAGNSEKRAHPVGLKKPNGFGLFDMLGNVWEWNADVFRATPGLSEDEAAREGSEDKRILRGGSWKNQSRQIRVSNRGRLLPDDREEDDGFRCIRDLSPR
jgi:formylglycine-generating enzyme required for sulfatase activity